MRELKGVLDGYPAVFLFNTNGFEFFNIGVKLGLVVFEWEQLSPMQQEQVIKQLNTNFSFIEENYN